MNRSIALAYGITGLAVAAALVAIVGVTTGLFRSDTPPAPVSDPPIAAQPVAPPPPAQPIAAPEATPVSGAPTAVPPDAEVVYVDAPPSARRAHHDDDDDDDDDDDHQGRRAHREHDDD